MNNQTMNWMKIGGAVMAVGTAAAVMGSAVKKNSTKGKMKKFAKKSTKTMNDIADNLGYLFR